MVWTLRVHGITRSSMWKEKSRLSYIYMKHRWCRAKSWISPLFILRTKVVRRWSYFISLIQILCCLEFWDFIRNQFVIFDSSFCIKHAEISNIKDDPIPHVNRIYKFSLIVLSFFFFFRLQQDKGRCRRLSDDELQCLRVEGVFLWRISELRRWDMSGRG